MKLYLMRCEGTGLYCLHDENAEPLPGQMHVSMESAPHGLNRITVTFNLCKDVVVVGSDQDCVQRETMETKDMENSDGLSCDAIDIYGSFQSL